MQELLYLLDAVTLAIDLPGNCFAPPLQDHSLVVAYSFLAAYWTEVVMLQESKPQTGKVFLVVGALTLEALLVGESSLSHYVFTLRFGKLGV